MANCPNCGSDYIQLTKETNISWGRAAAGWALFGVVGGAIGAVTGEDRNINACLDCGTSWKAEDLYKILQIIKNSTGESLDLAIEEDRFFMNEFIVELSPYLDEISKKEREGKRLIEEAQQKSVQSTATGCGAGCLISFSVCIGIASSTSGGVLLLTLLIPPVLGMLIGILLDSVNKKYNEKKKQETQRRVEIIKREAEEKLRNKIRIFMNNYY
ncbi:hypothetical protein PCC8801_1463 [Rippkaea orientalis PCC 8801]|uniref:Uncharacterized protein n=1 Tax=Rippkaea orientalis (strain PCC 8801 / RF-1) TaxID=41431 RepID=B7K4Q5_RIPO1|nr:hypothetical protein [Rippkaea orientalis]ACK65520.1 hypothetical protein PCC8801_1463 [Rippkaea orientalis PCC 8801]